MNWGKSTRYALYAAMEMAEAGPERPVRVTEIAERYRIPESALAKVLQQMVRSGIALGTRGVGGGYRLARPPAEVTVLEIIEIFEPPRSLESCLLADSGEDRCEGMPECRLRRLFDEVEEQARCTFASVSLETLVRS